VAVMNDGRIRRGDLVAGIREETRAGDADHPCAEPWLVGPDVCTSQRFVGDLAVRRIALFARHGIPPSVVVTSGGVQSCAGDGARRRVVGS